MIVVCINYDADKERINNIIDYVFIQLIQPNMNRKKTTTATVTHVFKLDNNEFLKFIMHLMILIFRSFAPLENRFSLRTIVRLGFNLHVRERRSRS